MRLWILAFSLLGFALFGFAVQAATAPSLVLTEKGVTDYLIVVDTDAVPAERTAARELQLHLERVTDAAFPIVNTTPQDLPGDHCLYVGSGKRFHEAVPGAGEAGIDGIRVFSTNKGIYFGGDRPRGALYAVYTFLENTVGCHWWTPTESEIPHKPGLEVPAQDVAYTPPIQVRDTFYYHAFDPLFAVRNQLNGHMQEIPDEYGGHHPILGWCHTFFQIMPPEEYFADHPEWFSMVDGERIDNGQLCLTNGEMRAEFIRNTLEWIRQHPEAGIISISQNDWRRQCECPRCRALAEHEGSEAGPVIDFVNEVAAAVETEYPDVLVMTLAYSYTRQAPLHVRPRHNVAIRLCSIECDFSKPLATGPRNADFLQDIHKWSKIAKHLYVWNYVTNFSQFLLPHPNWDGLAPDLRLFVDHKAIGVFEQGDRRSTCGDFHALRPWLMAKLLWNPNKDPDVLIRTFLDGYYGPAGDPLWEYIQVTRKAINEANIELGCSRRTTRDWLRIEDLNRITELFNEAEQRVAGNAILERRVEAARMPIDYVWLRRHTRLARQAERESKPFLGPEDPARARDDFMQKIAEFDCLEYGENHLFAHAAPGIANLFKETGPVPKTLASRDIETYLYRPARTLEVIGGVRSAALVQDAAAADKWALRMQPFAEKQAVRCPVDPEMQGLEDAVCYVLLRVDAIAKAGPACVVGTFDKRNGRVLSPVTVNIEQLQSEDYSAVRMPHERLRLDRHFFVETLANPEAVDAVYVAGFYLVER